MSSPSAATVARGQRPRVHVAPLAESPDVEDALFLADRYGLVLEPWQRLILTDWLARTQDNRYASLTCGLSCPRQNGKNGVIEVRELFGMVALGERILHTAHEVKTARKAFKRLQHFFGKQVNDPAAKYPELNALVTEVRSVNGQEAIVLANGGSVEIVARSKGSGRGFTVDVLVLDEAQDLGDEDLEALMPATSSAPLGNPQWVFTGTPPGPKVDGEVFYRTRASGLASDPRTCWHEWSVEAEKVEDINLDDPGLLHDTNPALAGGRLQVDVAEGERARFSDAGYARERLGWWAPRVAGQGGAIDPGAWAELAEPAAERGRSPVFAVATAPDRSWSAIAVAWRRSDGFTQVMLADYKPGATWVAERVTELRARWGAGKATVDKASQGLLPEGDAIEPSQADQAQAHNALSDAVVAKSLRHGNEPALNVSVKAARWKPLGDTRVLDRKGTTDISPLIAAALALHALSIPTDVTDNVW